jgi:hypothetical protein
LAHDLACVVWGLADIGRAMREEREAPGKVRRADPVPGGRDPSRQVG